MAPVIQVTPRSRDRRRVFLSVEMILALVDMFLEVHTDYSQASVLSPPGCRPVRDVESPGGDGEVGEGHHHARHHHGVHSLAGEEAGHHLALPVPPEVEVGPGGHCDPHDQDDQERTAVAQAVVHESGQTTGVEDRDQSSVEEISLQNCSELS